MNIAKLILSKARTVKTGTIKTDLVKYDWHAFDRAGDYIDYCEFDGCSKEYMRKRLDLIKNSILLRQTFTSDDNRIHWLYVDAKGALATGSSSEYSSDDFTRAISPKSRKPWYWDRKLNSLKRELPNYETDIQEGVNMRHECRNIVKEIESNFDVNSNYYRIQRNTAEEAMSIINHVDYMDGEFQQNLARDEAILLEREATGWTDERDDLQLTAW